MRANATQLSTPAGWAGRGRAYGSNIDSHTQYADSIARAAANVFLRRMGAGFYQGNQAQRLNAPIDYGVPVWPMDRGHLHVVKGS
jgi:hypothetical protein